MVKKKKKKINTKVQNDSINETIDDNKIEVSISAVKVIDEENKE